MNTKELIKKLNRYVDLTAFYAYPVLTKKEIAEIIKKLEKNEEFQELHESYIEIILDLYDQLEQKKLIVPKGFVEKWWIKLKEQQVKHPGQLTNFLEQMINELGLEIEKK